MALPDTNQQPVNSAQMTVGAAPAQTGEMEIDLIQLLYRLVEKAKFIILAALVGAVAMGVYTARFVTPMYQATAKLYMVNARDSIVNMADLQMGAQLTADYQEVFKTWEVHEMVNEELGLDYSYGKLASMVSVSNPNNTRMLYITATSASPAEAADVANAYARAAQKYIAQSMETAEPNMFSIALKPTAPFSPNRTKNIMTGFLAGFVLACGVFVLQFIMDDRLRTPEDIERYAGIPTLALVPEHSGAGKKSRKTNKADRQSGKEGQKS